MNPSEWPPLPYAEWENTRDTLHMWTQIVGKTRLALTPLENHWWNVPLYVTPRGLSTSAIPCGADTFEIEFDLVAHQLLLRKSSGTQHGMRLYPRSVADFYSEVMDALRRLGIDVRISVVPSEVPDPIPFPEDRIHATYDPAQATRFHRVLSSIDLVMKEHRAHFRGRTTPVHFFWGSFDLAVSLFSGLPVEPPSNDFIMRNAGDAQQIEVGWWPGDGRYGRAAFYAYAHPAPPGFERATLRSGRWDGTLGEYVLDWDDVRTAADPYATALEFARSAFRHACAVCGWDTGLAASAEGTPPPVR